MAEADNFNKHSIFHLYLAAGDAFNTFIMPIQTVLVYHLNPLEDCRVVR